MDGADGRPQRQGGGLQGKGHDRRAVAACLCAARRRLVSALGHHLAEGEPFSALLLSMAIGRNRLAPVRSKGINCLVFVDPAKVH